MRTLSHTEAEKVLRCMAEWDYAYGGHLAGSTLKPKIPVLALRAGKAWGRAVAAWHEKGTDAAHDALEDAIAEDARQIIDAGQAFAGSVTEAVDLGDELADILAHYMGTADRLNLSAPEMRLEVGIDIATNFEGFVDGLHTDPDGSVWIVEFKLRANLTALEHLYLSRQHRRYAWAAREMGVDVVGVISDERLREVPGEVVLNKDGTPRKKQARCHADDYERACAESGVEPDGPTLASLRAKRWHQRERIIFRPGELDEAGEELRSIARLIHDLDSGGMYPVRNPSPRLCGGCQFKTICADPVGDADLVDALFTRKVAKRDRPLAAVKEAA